MRIRMRSAPWVSADILTRAVHLITMKTRDEIIDWLRDAYAMERALEVALKKQAASEELNPQLRERADHHLAETRRHAELVKQCLEDLGTDTSMLKTGIATTMETLKGMGTSFAKDERVKDVLAAYASEHFEIACYRALKAGGERLGLVEVVALCESIIPDEEAMADWLSENLPVVVRSYLEEQAVR
jgi:ferritin-like metal-binding protein YciE